MKLFMSHNHRDKPRVRVLSRQLQLAGADVWLDEWQMRPGDSIPLKVNEGLEKMDQILVCWSANANGARWVETEFATGLSRSLAPGSHVRVIPVIFDDTPLPTIISHLMWIDLRTDAVDAAVNSIMGFRNDAERLKAIQEALVESDIPVLALPDGEVYVCCSNCGAPTSELTVHEDIDEKHDDVYYSVSCRACGR